MSRMWWNNNDKACGWAMMAWDWLCHPKGIGGLGFRDLRCFNVALIGRQVWHLINCKETLCFKVLGAKYFPNGDVFNPKSMDKPSYTWKNIAKATSMLHASFGCNVGNGRSTKISHDKWVRENNVCELLNDSRDGLQETRV
ncbi:hypothetical protein ERO13_1Z049385v2, partial [Gossypium hirsutum]